ncbi:non-ribosomal peptide synthetase [Paenibacillus lutrae]|uniref:Amino acid adenylation domain-containing protein n=1 Tax=Paenibacillus lutrae TaxID=2078573 RepID=A0A7X3FF96_9BACL|nr:non-ribosomal peptide synthetase [Paenibacillus lutrae]MVO98616.1 amino acid adenylation domain-containing protein [Paenibacillus lutrae]
MSRLDLNVLLSDRKYTEQEKFWLDNLAGVSSDHIELTDMARLSDEGRRYSEKFLDAAAQERLLELCNHSDMSLYIAFTAMVHIVLYRCHGVSECVIGMPVLKLTRTEETLNETVLLRSHSQGNMTFKELLIQTKRAVLEAYRHQDYPLPVILEKLTERSNESLPVIPLMSYACMYDGLHEHAFRKEAQVEVVFGLERTAEGLKLVLDCDSELYSEEQAALLQTSFHHVLEHVSANIQTSIGDVPILSEEEKNRIVVGFNESGVLTPKMTTIDRLFEEQVNNNPGRTALIVGEKSYTYGELNQKADALAARVIAAGGKPDQIIALLADRSFDMLVGIMGILKSGCAFLPVDPNYPASRIQHYMSDSQAEIIVTATAKTDIDGFKGTRIDLKDLQHVQGSITAAASHQSSNLAYVIYTSGSTGKPKGVMIEHRSVIHFIEAMCDRIAFGEEETLLSVTTYSFDIFYLETLLPLLRGMTVVLADEASQIDPGQLAAVIGKHQPDYIQTTPSRLKLMLENERCAELMGNFKAILVGGEAFPSYLLEQLKPYTAVKIYNMYGPTETTIWSAMTELKQDAPLTIGSPIANTQIYILDDNRNPVPVSAMGELHISGAGLARGYWNQPDLTREKFVDNPFLTGSKMYKTGDYARWLPNGTIEYIGRTDQLVKLRGYRIELGEIEQALNELEGITGAVVLAKRADDGSLFLCGYIVTAIPLPTATIKALLKEKLPEYMIPAFLVPVETIPLTPNGKVDRESLRKRSHEAVLPSDNELPMNDLEQTLAEIWSEVLQMSADQIGTESSFFDVGGDSISMVQMVALIDKQFPGKVTLTDLFVHKNIKMLAQLILKDEEAPEITLHDLAVFALPERYFAGNESTSSESSYRIAASAEMSERIQETALQAGITKMDVLLAACFYLMSDITGSEELLMYTALDRTDEVTPLHVNLSGIEDISDLFGNVREAREAAVNGSVRIGHIRAIEERGDHSVAALIYDKSKVTAGYALSGLFDLVLELDPDDVNISLEFDNRRLDGARMIELLKKYMTLLRMMVQKREQAELR